MPVPHNRRARRRQVAATGLLALALLLAACGDEDGDSGASGPERACASEVPDSGGWRGVAEADLATGEAEVAEFNEYLEGAPEPIATSPCDAARVFLHLDRPPPEGGESEVEVEPEGAADATVTVTLEGLADDSVAAERWILEFEPAADERVRLAGATRGFRCQPGRGHQDFSPELCL